VFHLSQPKHVLKLVHLDLDAQCVNGSDVVGDEECVGAAILGHSFLDGCIVVPVVVYSLDRSTAGVGGPEEAGRELLSPGREHAAVTAAYKDLWLPRNHWSARAARNGRDSMYGTVRAASARLVKREVDRPGKVGNVG